jgi:hypothetical protein
MAVLLDALSVGTAQVLPREKAMLLPATVRQSPLQKPSPSLLLMFFD